VGQERAPSAAAAEVAQYHDYLAQRVGTVRLSVLHQRLRDEHGLAASWGAFYRYVQAHWRERLRTLPRLTIRLDDPPPGEEHRPASSTPAAGTTRRRAGSAASTRS